MEKSRQKKKQSSWSCFLILFDILSSCLIFRQKEVSPKPTQPPAIPMKTAHPAAGDDGSHLFPAGDVASAAVTGDHASPLGPVSSRLSYSPSALDRAIASHTVAGAISASDHLSDSAPALKGLVATGDSLSPAASGYCRRKLGQAAPPKRGVNTVVVVKWSSDREEDFRRSMEEMIRWNGIRRPEELEDLLACYLSLNAGEHHDVIGDVFRRVLGEKLNNENFD